MRKKKPAKPYKDFPLFLHATGQWAKKIRGRMHYFGTDAAAAAEKNERDREALYAGRTPAPVANTITVMDLANRFLTEKRALRDSGELSPRTWRDYYACCDRMVKAFGKKTPLVSLVLPVDELQPLPGEEAEPQEERHLGFL
ncbi:MAG: hypothetical protein U0791_23690 [Gemmataceae bacterium]